MKLTPARLLLAPILALVLEASPLLATDLHNVLIDYTLTSWGQRDGLPSSIIRAIAQDNEGYLWLGTDAGPVRFDGARFTPWEAVGPTQLPKGSVRALCTTRDGSLWFGFGGQGGVSRLYRGQLRNYGAGDGIPETAVSDLFEDPDGTLWLGTTVGWYRLNGDRWEQSGAGLPKVPSYGALVDSAGRLLVATASGVFSRPRGEDAFKPVEGFRDIVRDLVQDRTGTIWATDNLVGFRRLDERTASTYRREEGRGSRLLEDSAGNLWVGTLGQGLWRVRFDQATDHPIVEKATTLAGFSDDGIQALFEDSEGNIWAGTLDGLNRLTPHKITPVMELGVVSGVEATPEGSVWVGTVGTLVRFFGSSVGQQRILQPLRGVLTAMHADERGTLWVATGNRLLRFDRDGSSPVELAGELRPRRITAITSDSRAGLWMSDADLGLLRWTNGRLEKFTLPSALRQARIVVIQTDRSGRLWLAFSDERVATVQPDGAVHVFDREDGLDAGTYRTIYQDRDGVIWLGGTEGLTRFARGRFSTLHTAHGFPAAPLTAIVGDDAGCLWLGTEGAGEGIARVAIGELENAIDNPSYRVRYRRFDKFDGFAGTPRWYGIRAAVRAEDGRLWFVAGRGVTIIDPRSLPIGPATPVRPRIEGAVVDDVRMRALSPGRLGPHMARLQIDYTVLNLTSPPKTRFRYRLEGFDRDWIDAGFRRQAFYTNLPPRNYEFRVVASNDDGTWSDAAGVWAFTIQPTFYQTTWFLVACAFGLAASVGAVWRLHLRRVRSQFSLLLGERARVSREIHDTLLQGLFGVALRCDAIAGSFDSSTPWLREQFLRMRKDIQDYIQDARESIRDLRSPRLAGRDLQSALKDAGERVLAGTPVSFDLSVSGSPRPCPPVVEQQLLRIGQEAIVNVVRHAGARRVQLELRYDDRLVSLRVADDGRGFDPGAVSEGNGHFGLTSMKERAESLGGTLRITSGRGRGAEVEATVPLRQVS